VPSHADLTLRLNAILADSAPGGGPVEVVARKPFALMSFFPIEAVTCRRSDGTLCHLFLKYESGKNHGAHGHRGDLAYEAEVYRQILARREGFRPRFCGSSTGSAGGDTWLALEYLDPSVRVREINGRTEQLAAMVLASRWIARFHADLETAAARGSLGFLRRYDEDYYVAWARRTAELTSTLGPKLPWLSRLCELSRELLAPLLAAPLTVIHGEFYTNNILLCDGSVHAVDWESAVLGPGAIDVAALTEGDWPTQVVQACEREYMGTRWARERDAHFEEVLEAARLYLHFRWLGERSGKTRAQQLSWRLERLRSAAARLGLADA